jgi:hypothetical protein
MDDLRKLHIVIPHRYPHCIQSQFPNPNSSMKLLHAATLTFSMPAAGPGVVGGTSLYRVTRKCCEGGMSLSSKACGMPPCSTPTRIMDNSCGHDQHAVQ